MIRKRFLEAFIPLALIACAVSWSVFRGPDLKAEVIVQNGPASPSPGTGVVVTNTSSILCLDSGNTCSVPFSSVVVRNCPTSLTVASPSPQCTTSSPMVYVRVFHCGDTALTIASPTPVASTSAGFPLANGESVAFTINPKENANGTANNGAPLGYCAISVVSSTSSATRLLVISK
jgi:hypothetical protein